MVIYIGELLIKRKNTLQNLSRKDVTLPSPVADADIASLAPVAARKLPDSFLATTLAFVNKQMSHANSGSDDSGGSSYSTTFGISAAATAVASTWCSNSNSR